MNELENFENKNPISYKALNRALEDVWAYGPRAWSDTCHPDPTGTKFGQYLVGDMKFVKSANDLDIPTSTLWSVYYPWSRKKSGWTPSEINKTNALYLSQLDQLFGLGTLEESGLFQEILSKPSYVHSSLPNLLSATLGLSLEAGVPIHDMLLELGRSSTNLFKSADGSLGFTPIEGEYFVMMSDGKTVKEGNKSVKLKTSDLLKSGAYPSSFAIDLAQAIAISISEINLWHFGNSYGGIKNSPTAMDWALYQLQMCPESKDRHEFVVNGENPINLNELISIFGQLTISALISCLEKGAPLTLEEAELFTLK